MQIVLTSALLQINLTLTVNIGSIILTFACDGLAITMTLCKVGHLCTLLNCQQQCKIHNLLLMGQNMQTPPSMLL